MSHTVPFSPCRALVISSTVPVGDGETSEAFNWFQIEVPELSEAYKRNPEEFPERLNFNVAYQMSIFKG